MPAKLGMYIVTIIGCQAEKKRVLLLRQLRLANFVLFELSV